MMNLVFIDSPEGKRWGAEDYVTPERSPQDHVTRLPLGQQDKAEGLDLTLLRIQIIHTLWHVKYI